MHFRSTSQEIDKVGPPRANRRRIRLALIGGLALLASGLMPLMNPVTAHVGDPGTTSPELQLLGNNNLNNRGLNGEVAVVGNTVVVGSGMDPAGGTISGFYNPLPCPATNVNLVDISNPRNPRKVGKIPVEAGVAALDVAALRVSTPSFTGDLAAIAKAACGSPPDAKPCITRGGFATSAANCVDRGVEYWSITNPDRPKFLGRYKADSDRRAPGDPTKCGTAKGQNVGPEACSSSQRSVHLMQRPSDGKVLSVSTEPFATASGFPSGDLRVVDVTDPQNPTQVGSYPPPRSRSGFSSNGCRPFSAGRNSELYAGGTKALLPYLDAGLFNIDVSNPASPTLAGETDPSAPGERAAEGNHAYATIAGATENLALLSDADWNAPETNLRIASPATSPQGLTAGDKFGCEAVFTLFDPEDTAQIYRHAGSQVPAGAGNSAQMVYVGLACPGTPLLGDAAGNPVNPAGKIAIIDRGVTDRQRRTIDADNNPATPPTVDPNSQIPAPPFCSLADRALRVQQDGAIGAVFDAGFGCSATTPPATNCAFGPDGVPLTLNIPVMALDRPAATQLRNTLCPSVSPPASGKCTSTTPVTGAMVDKPGDTDATSDWGALRVINLATSTQVGQYETPRSQVFPPPDLGVYSVHHAVAQGNRAYVAWNSDGVRILDLTNPAAPTEIGHWVPPDKPDPTTTIPSKAYVVGVAVSGCNVVISDINSGMYVLADPGCAVP